MTSVSGDEDFVTAVLAEFHDDHSVTLVNCGHPPPMLHAQAESGPVIDTGEPEPPQSHRPAPNLVTHHLPEGARLLFYTDGLVETRDRDGSFFPLTERAAALHTGSLEDALDGLLDQLADHVEHQITDDVALVLVERQPNHDELRVDRRS